MILIARIALALLFLPISIPLLLIDYCETKYRCQKFLKEHRSWLQGPQEDRERLIEIYEMILEKESAAEIADEYFALAYEKEPP